MKGINKVILLGTVGQDTELKKISDTFTVANFSLATTKSHKDATTNEWVDQTEWHNITCFNKLAEIADRNVTKGSNIYVEGEIKTTSYEKDGSKRYRTEIIANTISVVSKKDSSKTTTGADLDPQEDDLPF